MESIQRQILPADTAVFLVALARARETAPNLKGVIVGDGPEGPELERQAKALNLGPENLTLGARCLARDQHAFALR